MKIKAVSLGNLEQHLLKENKKLKAELKKKDETINELNIKLTTSVNEQKEINSKLEEQIKILKRNKILDGCKHSRKMSELKKTIAKMEQNENKNFEKKMKNTLIKNGWTKSRAHLAANSNLKYIRKRDKEEMKKFIIERSKNMEELQKTRAEGMLHVLNFLANRISQQG